MMKGGRWEQSFGFGMEGNPDSEVETRPEMRLKTKYRPIEGNIQNGRAEMSVESRLMIKVGRTERNSLTQEQVKVQTTRRSEIRPILKTDLIGRIPLT
jgi:hypothetical protein